MAAGGRVRLAQHDDAEGAPRGPAPPSPPRAPARGRLRAWAAALVAAAALLLLYRPGAKDFWDASEARPPQSAREMRLHGDLLVQRTNGEVDLTKPPVYAWLCGASFALLGESEAAARLPNALVTALVLLLAYRLGAGIGGRRAGLLSAFLLLTQARFLWQARLSELELPLTLAVVCAYAALGRALEAASPGARFRWAAAAFASVGLGFAVKGPVVLLLVLPGAVAGAIWTGRARALLSPAALAALPFAALVGLPWYLAVVARDPAHLETFLSYARGENVGHLRGPFYYLVQAPLAMLPWTPLVLAGLVRGTRGLEPRARDRARRALAGFATTFAVLSFVPAKQTHYLIPVFPLAAALAGVVADRALARATAASRRVAAAAAVAVVVAEAVVAGHVLPAMDATRSARPFFEAVAARTGDAPLAWTVFGSHSDYLWYLGADRVGTTGVPELLAPTPEATVARVRAFLAEPGPRYAVVFGEQADALGAGAVVLRRDDAFQKKRRRLALVANAAGAAP